MNSKLITRLSGRRSDRTRIIWLAAIFLLVVPNYLTGVARASAGDLVAGFGLGGKVTTDFSSNIDVAAAVAVYPDGRILVAGSSQAIALARYNPDGSLDQTFGNGGLVAMNPNEFGNATAVAIQSDGKIVVAGSISRADQTDDFLVVRYNEDGTLDYSFGQDGVVTTHFYNATAFAADMALTPDGEIVVAGTIYSSTSHSDFAIARYKSNGDLDETFGSVGRVRLGLKSAYEKLAAIALTSKGEIVLVGDTLTPQPEVYNSDYLVVRLNHDGSPDESFGVDGRVITDFTSVDMPGDVALTRSGEIIVVGTVAVPWSFDFVIARYDRHGSLDPSFGTGGRVFTDFSMRDDFAFAVAVRPNGKIVVAGRSGWVISSSADDFALARYERDGTLDQSFGSSGLITTDFAGYTDDAKAVTILPSGRIVVAGLTWDARIQPFNPSIDFAVAEYEGR